MPFFNLCLCLIFVYGLISTVFQQMDGFKLVVGFLMSPVLFTALKMFLIHLSFNMVLLGGVDRKKFNINSNTRDCSTSLYSSVSF